MARLDNIKRIIIEEFKEEDRELVSKFAYILNTFMEQVLDGFQGKINFDNLSWEAKTVTVKVNSTGTPLINSQIAHGLTNRIQGMLCIRADNLDNTTQYVPESPFISFTPIIKNNNNLIQINNITGLQADTNYRLTLLIIS